MPSAIIPTYVFQSIARKEGLKMSRKTVLVFLVVFLVMSLEGNSQQAGQGLRKIQTAIPVVNDIRSIVVQIRYEADKEGKKIRGIAGTGFLVSKEAHVITNSHVIIYTRRRLKLDGATNVKFTVAFAIPDSIDQNENQVRGSFSLTEVTVIEMDQGNDLALLKCHRNPFKGEISSGIVFGKNKIQMEFSVAELETELPKEGSDVLISGYPLNIPSLVTQRGMVSSQTFQSINNEVPGGPDWFRFPHLVNVLFIDAVVNPGNSGGPVYSPSTGRVVGVLKGNVQSPLRLSDGTPIIFERGGRPASLMQNAGLAVVIPITYAIEMLEKNGVRWEGETPE